MARVFVPNGGMKRSYTFKKGDTRIVAGILQYCTTEIRVLNYSSRNRNGLG